MLCLDRMRSSHATVTFLESDEIVPWAEIVRLAERQAQLLARSGLRPGDRVGISAHPAPGGLAALLACWQTGIIPFVVPSASASARPGARVTAEITERTTVASATALVLDVETASLLRRHCPELFAWDAPAHLDGGFVLLRADQRDCRFDRIAHDDATLLQFSSGSTGPTKLIALSADTTVRHVDHVAAAAAIGDQDRVLSWLPLSHDMGFVGALLLAAFCQADLLIGPPRMFLRSPRWWMRSMAEHAATVTVAPASACSLLGRMGPGSNVGSLRRVRSIFVGAEPIDVKGLLTFAARFAGNGLGPEAVKPAYGLAEATLVVAVAERFESAKSPLSMDVPDASERSVAPGDHAVVGSPLHQTSVEVSELPGEGGIGRVRVRSSTGMLGYVDANSGSVEPYGLIDTGDLGFWHDGRLVICGRDAEVVFVAGRKILPQSMERFLERLIGAREGSVLVLPSEDHGPPAVVIEGLGEVDLARVRAAVSERFGAGVGTIAQLPRGTVPRTTSGKVRRYRVRQMVQGAAPTGGSHGGSTSPRAD